MLLKRAAGVFLLVVIVLTAIGAYIAWDRGGILRSDPAAPRANDFYDRLLSPVSANPSPTNFFERVTVEHSATRITVVAPAPEPGAQPEPFRARIHRPNPGESAKIGNGTISLAGIGVATLAPKTNFAYSIRVPAQFFSPDLRPLSTVETRALVPEWETQVDFRGVFPTAKFVFARSNIAEMKVLSFQLFDARTHRNLTGGGYSSGSHEGNFWHECQVGLWHQAPLEVFVTVGVGPTESIAAPAKIGQLIDFPGGRFKLLAIVDGAITGSSSRHDGRTNVTSMDMPTRRTDRTESTVVFMTSPNSSGLPMDFQFLGKDGRILTSSRSSSGELSSHVLEASADAITQIRLVYYPSVHRIIFRLPELPGLPPENRGLKNLFDARIPSMRFEQEWTYQEAVGQLLQMSMPPLPLNFTNAYFPLVYENTTTRALFRDLNARLANPEEDLRINHVEHKVEVKRSPVLVVLEQLRKLLPK